MISVYWYRGPRDRMGTLDKMAATATRFSEAQREKLEKAYSEGLKSCKLGTNGPKIQALAEECNLPIQTVKVWINNRNKKARKEAARLGLNEWMDEVNEDEGPSASPFLVKKAPTHRRLSAWNIFCSQVFKKELRDAPKDLRIQMARDLYRKLGADEKAKLELEAQSSAPLSEFTEEQIDKEITKSMQRILKEMQYIEQFDAIGVCLVTKPDGQLLSSSTLKGEEFLLSEKTVSQKFSAFCNVPTEKSYTRDDVRLFLNRQYSFAAGEPKRVPYKNYLKSFHVEGWPETVPFKTPARMGANQLKAVMEQQEVIRFVITSHQQSSSLPQVGAGEILAAVHEPMGQGDRQQEANQLESNEMEDAAEGNEPAEKRKKCSGRSFVKKGDIVPVYAPINEDGDDSSQYAFWLFCCSGKIKADRTINGKWLMQSEDERKFVVLPQKRSIFETNVMIFNNQRIVLSDCHFQEKENGCYKLTETTLSWLQDLACEAPDV